jgi:phosphocarrier protein
MLAAGKGSTVRLSAQGEDEAEAISQLEALIKQRFGEDE